MKLRQTVSKLIKDFNPSQPRDDHGRWSGSGSAQIGFDEANLKSSFSSAGRFLQQKDNTPNRIALKFLSIDRNEDKGYSKGIGKSLSPVNKKIINDLTDSILTDSKDFATTEDDWDTLYDETAQTIGSSWDSHRHPKHDQIIEKADWLSSVADLIKNNPKAQASGVTVGDVEEILNPSWQDSTTRGVPYNVNPYENERSAPEHIEGSDYNSETLNELFNALVFVKTQENKK